MIKHTQTVRWLLPVVVVSVCLTIFGGLALKGLNKCFDVTKFFSD